MKKIRFLILALVGLLGGVVSASGTTVYVDPVGNGTWLDANAKISLNVYTDGQSNNAWVTEREELSGGVIKFTFDDTYNRMIIVRGENQDAWGWNQTENITPAAGKLYKANGYSGEQLAYTVEDYTEPAAAGYLIDFNTSIPTTSSHDWTLGAGWDHIVATNNYDGYGPYYMQYGYASDEGIDGSGTLKAFRQYAGDNWGGAVANDVLVSPKVKGTISMFVKDISTGSYPSFVEIYAVDESGTTLGELIQKFETDKYVASDEYDGWSTITLELSEAQRIGIRAQYTQMDNFTATSATIPEIVRLSFNTIAKTADQGSTAYYNQNEDGSVNARFLVSLTNSGTVNFKAGETENYTLSVTARSYASGNNLFEPVGSFDIPVDIAAGKTSEPFEVSINVPKENISKLPSNGWAYWFLKENVSGQISSSYLYAGLVKYESKFIFDKEGTTYYSSSTATTTPIDFGKIEAETTVNYEIYNAGTAPLTINGVTVDKPFTTDAPTSEFVVAAGEKKVVKFTLPVDEGGVFAGNLTIVYTNANEDEAKTYSLPIQGTVFNASKNYITFDNGKEGEELDGQFPAGSIHTNQVYISTKTENEVTNYYLQSTSTVTKFVTPLLTAKAGEAFTFDSWYSGYSYSAGITVYSSTDRINWTQIYKTSQGALGSAVKTFTVAVPEAGDYYIAFELNGNALLDNIYGLEPAEAPAHDWYLTDEANIPASGKQNDDYTASIKVKNISGEADVIETATLYVGGEAVATVDNTALVGNEMTAVECTGRTNNYSNIENPVELTFTYKPHVYGTLPVYVELKSGEFTQKTAAVDVDFKKEVTEGDEIVVGTASESASYNNAIIDFFNFEQAKTSDIVYTAEQLNKFGIKQGAAISSFTFKGSCSSAKTLSSSLTAWYGFKSGEITPNSPDKESMTEVKLYEGSIPVVSGENVFTINLDEPIVYDGTSDLRFYFEGGGGGTWASIQFEYDDNYQNMYWSNATAAKGNPILYVELAAEPNTLSGTVTDGENAVKGAKVTIRNNENDIEYFATTDAEGAYTIDVVRDQLTYTATVTADGYETLTDETVLNFTEGSQTKDFVLTKEGAFKLAYDNSWTGKAGLKNWKNSVDMTVENAQVGDIIRVAYNYETTMLRFSNTQNWNDIYVYAWDANENALTAAWHGDKMENFSTNDYGEKVYDIYIPEGAAGVVISNGYEQQTANITDLTQLGYYVTSDQRDGEGHFVAIPWPDNNVQLQLQDAEGNLINGTEQTNIPSGENSVDIMITSDILAQLANNAVVSLKGENATITGISLIEKEPISVTISASQYATLYYQNLNLTIPEGVTAYAAVKNGNTIELNEIADVIPAGVPVVINGDAGTYDFQIAAEANEFTGENDLTGTEEDVKDEEAGYKYYVLCWKDSSKSAVGFYFQSGSNGAYAQVKAHQAYMKINASEAPAKGFDIFINGDATGIDSIELSTLNDNDKVYTLSGVRVNANRVAKGVYIVNGQKVVIK